MAGKAGLIVKIVLAGVGAITGIVGAVAGYKESQKTDEQIKQLTELKKSLSK